MKSLRPVQTAITPPLMLQRNCNILLLDSTFPSLRIKNHPPLHPPLPLSSPVARARAPCRRAPPPCRTAAALSPDQRSKIKLQRDQTTIYKDQRLESTHEHQPAGERADGVGARENARHRAVDGAAEESS